jgi:DNA polymerase-3 subunit alpha
MSKDKFSILKDLALKGLKNKLNIVDDAILDRLTLELDMIKNANSVDYYLTIEKIVEVCNRKNILRSVGRNTSGNSLINYCLDITKINPIEYDLSIYRFLNPICESTIKPDIDLEVSRDSPQDFYNLVKFELIESGYKIFKIACPKSKAKISNNFEELLFNGIEYIIVPFKYFVSCSDFTPQDNYIVKNEIEILINSDFAPLNQNANGYEFDIININYLVNIKKTSLLSKCPIHPYDIPLNLPEVFDIFSNGETHQIPYFDSEGMRCKLKEWSPRDIRELALISALYVPVQRGLDLLEEIVARKMFGYDDQFSSDSRVAQILSPTYGVIAYQDTFSQIINKVAGIELSKAELYRRAIRKNTNKREIEEFRANFLLGCIKCSDLNESEANKLLVQLIDSLSYALPMSHVLSNSITAYWSAYLKLYHRSEFDLVHNVV